MNSLESVKAQQPVLTIDIREIITDKLNKTTNQIVKDVITTIVYSSSMSPQAFVDTQITPKQAPLSQIDERTSQFFQKIIKLINEALDKVPTLSQSFIILGAVTQDQYIRKKLIEGIALPSIKELIIDLDSIKHSIVNDIISS